MTAIASTAIFTRTRSRSAVSSAKDQSLWLAVDEAVHYRGLGAGRVIRHDERDFKGSKRTFAVISFPHRDMTAQVLLGDDSYASKIRPVVLATTVKSILKVLHQAGDSLARTWDDREEAGRKRLRDGSPAEWAEMLRDYASARRGGMAITSSDADLVRETIALLSAEYACGAETEFAQAFELVSSAYTKASSF